MMCVLKLNYNMSDRYWKVSRDVTLASAVYPVNAVGAEARVSRGVMETGGYCGPSPDVCTQPPIGVK